MGVGEEEEEEEGEEEEEEEGKWIKTAGEGKWNVGSH